MDAKPQRLGMTRFRGDENAPPPNRTGKTLHHRTKSTPALSALVDAARAKEPLKRPALGNVSNTAGVLRLAKDDISTALLKNAKNIAGLARPAQRISQGTAAKALVDTESTLAKLNAVDQLPVNPRKPPVRRGTLSKGSSLPLVEPAGSSASKNLPAGPKKDLCADSETDSADSDGSVHTEESKQKDSIADDISGLPKAEGIYIEDNGEIKIYNPPLSTSSSPEAPETKPVSLPNLTSTQGVSADLPNRGTVVNYIQNDTSYELEESWEEENENYLDDGYVTTCTQHYTTDNITGGLTTVLFPEFNANVRRELALAKQTVEATRSIEDYEDECFDQTMVAEYGEDIFDYMRSLEIKLLPNPHYMDCQTEIQWSMRSVLMDWLVQVHLRFNLLPETLFLCANYIDRFLSCKIVSLGKLQLVGATAIFIAAKYEEINCPSVQEIVYMVDKSYTADEILRAERFMLSLLQFELGWPGPMNFLRRISKADDYDFETRTLAKYFLEITLMDERFVGSPPSFLAAGAHCLARMILRKGDWTPAHVHYSNYTYSQLFPLVSMMLDCCEFPMRHHPAIYEKYSDRRFKRSSYFVENEVMRGFEIPPVSRTLSGGRHPSSNKPFTASQGFL
ncbi:B-type cyclin [Ophidiomyces ophidiicola]|uniref:B-type cyclin n=1 Tax=Ophidiomyces ophidiicola TaxID=1387563 RepID=UPI0020C56054|nr:B-type cyclin [Ophidiomyces ophidiicola]KAI1950911.1 B-type cyclin [Ophidiomyces ophidiicola]KAI2057736.1 B-type cyclin [Ophidiomyces ophidiicola]